MKRLKNMNTSELGDWTVCWKIVMNSPSFLVCHLITVQKWVLKLEFELLKEVAKLAWLGGVKLWCSMISAGRHRGYYRFGHCGVSVDKCQRNGWVSWSGQWQRQNQWEWHIFGSWWHGQWIGHVGGRLGHDSCEMLIMLYELKGRGVPDSSSARVTKSAWTLLLRSWSKLQYQRSMLWAGRYIVLGVMLHAQPQLQRW